MTADAFVYLGFMGSNVIKLVLQTALMADVPLLMGHVNVKKDTMVNFVNINATVRVKNAPMTHSVQYVRLVDMGLYVLCFATVLVVYVTY